MKVQQWLPADTTHQAVVFDEGRDAHRMALLPSYKAHRAAVPAVLRVQMPYCRAACEALAVPALAVPSVEGDDVLAALAHAFARSSPARRATIVSGDKDLLQAVGDGVGVAPPDTLEELATVEAVVAKIGVEPRHVADYLALVGDAADHIPGVKGIGSARAAKLIGQFGGLDEIYARLDEVQPETLREVLRAGREDAYLSRRLTTLRRDFDLPVRSMDELLLANGDEPFARWLTHFGFAALAARHATRSAGRQLARAAGPSAALARPGYDGSRYRTLTDFGEVAEYLALSRGRLLAVDCETTSTDARSARLVGVSLCFKAGEGVWVPATAMTPEVVGALAGRLSELPLVAHNARYDAAVLGRHGMPLHPGMDDTMVLSGALSGAAHSHGIDHLSERYLGLTKRSFEDAITGGKGFSSAKERRASSFEDADPVSAMLYAAEDADATLRLHAELSARATEQARRLYSDLDRPAFAACLAAEAAGIAIHVPAAVAASEARAALEAVTPKTIFDKRVLDRWPALGPGVVAHGGGGSQLRLHPEYGVFFSRHGAMGCVGFPLAMGDPFVAQVVDPRAVLEAVFTAGDAGALLLAVAVPNLEWVLYEHILQAPGLADAAARWVSAQQQQQRPEWAGAPLQAFALRALGGDNAFHLASLLRGCEPDEALLLERSLLSELPLPFPLTGSAMPLPALLDLVAASPVTGRQVHLDVVTGSLLRSRADARQALRRAVSTAAEDVRKGILVALAASQHNKVVLVVPQATVIEVDLSKGAKEIEAETLASIPQLLKPAFSAIKGLVPIARNFGGRSI
jgi:5'-3' exonuclease